MAYRVEIVPRARRDLDDILSWLVAQQAGARAIEWFRDLEEAIASLAEFPERCALAPESAVVSFAVRQLLYGRKPDTYRILFTIDGLAVKVLHIRHARRGRSAK